MIIRALRRASACCVVVCASLLAVGVGQPAAATPTITEFPLPSQLTSPVLTALGPDGNVWFTEGSTTESVVQNIGRITPSGVITEFPISTHYPGLRGITAGPDGALWFTEEGAAKIGRITTSGQVTEYPLPRSDAWPHSIVAGPDGALWFTENGRIGRLTTAGALTEFTVSLTTPYYLEEITAGRDGALWFTDESGLSIDRITTRGKISSYPLTPRGPNWNPTPSGITTGPDGALWFTILGQDQIGQITTRGAITQYNFPNWDPNELIGPSIITTGPDGALWFSEAVGNSIGRITTAGSISQYPIPSPQTHSAGICSGADGAIWFAEPGQAYGRKIGRLTPDLAPPVVSGLAPMSGSAAGGTTVTITGFEFTATSVVRFGGVRAASVTVMSPTKLMVVSPRMSPGTYHVRVSTAQGTSTPVSQDRYTVLPSS